MPRLRVAALRAVPVVCLVLAAGCGTFGRAGAVTVLTGPITVDSTAKPPAVLIADEEKGTWRLGGGAVDDLRELDRATVEVRGSAEPTDPRKGRTPGRFDVQLYRLLEMGGRPALVGRLAWEGPSLILVELDRDDRRVPLVGPAVPRLERLMGNAIWIAGEPRQGVFLVERFGILRRTP